MKTELIEAIFTEMERKAEADPDEWVKEFLIFKATVEASIYFKGFSQSAARRLAHFVGIDPVLARIHMSNTLATVFMAGVQAAKAEMENEGLEKMMELKYKEVM
jgi:hypothetical protein